MGKKTKRTRWRTLDMPANTDKPKIDEGREPSQEPSSTPKKEQQAQTDIKTIIEDEYTRITTPRQDLLFKKGYLCRKKPEKNSENMTDTAEDSPQDENAESKYSEEGQSFVCPNPSYIDPSAMYYGGSYEIYDPFTGNVTVVMPPTGSTYTSSTCSPMLSTVPCRPLPLQPMQWFNPLPSPDWICSYNMQDKQFSPSESQRTNGLSPDSSLTPESLPEAIEDMGTGAVFPSSYVYPGFVFGAPIFNVDGVNVQYCTPTNSTTSNDDDSSTLKRKKKRKRRRRSGEEGVLGSESSLEDNYNLSLFNEGVLDMESLVYREVGLHQVPDYDINAPEFVPSSHFKKRQNELWHNVCLQDKQDYNECKANLTVQRKPFDSRHDKQDSSARSSNSDSGISSPGSDDTTHSKPEFKERKDNGNTSPTDSGQKDQASSGKKRRTNKNKKPSPEIKPEPEIKEDKVETKKSNENGKRTKVNPLPKYIESKLLAEATMKQKNKDAKERLKRKRKNVEKVISKKVQSLEKAKVEGKSTNDDNEEQENEIIDEEIRPSSDIAVDGLADVRHDELVYEVVTGLKGLAVAEQREDINADAIKEQCNVAEKNQNDRSTKKKENGKTEKFQSDETDSSRGSNADEAIVYSNLCDNDYEIIAVLDTPQDAEDLKYGLSMLDEIAASENGFANVTDKRILAAMKLVNMGPADMSITQLNSAQDPPKAPKRKKAHKKAKSFKSVVSAIDSKGLENPQEAIQLPITAAVTRWLNEEGSLCDVVHAKELLMKSKSEGTSSELDVSEDELMVQSLRPRASDSHAKPTCIIS